MTGRQSLAAALLALGLTACGTTAPTRYLTLAAAPPAGAGPDVAGLVLRPPEVRWPAAFDRLEVARPTGAVEVTVDELARWSAAPGRLATAALTADLVARLPGAVIAPWTDPAPADAVVVMVQVETLSERPAGYGMLAAVSIARGPAASRRWTFQAEADGAHDAQGEARALSRLLSALADRIAGDLASGLSAPPASGGTANVGLAP
jgi:uncharacterized lipoprotein YmbA